MDEFDQLKEVAATQHQMRQLTLDCARGIAGVQALVHHLPSLVELRSHGTSLAATGHLSKEALLSLLSPNLRCLVLEETPELDDAHCVVLAEALSRPDCQLEELCLVSSISTNTSARAMTNMLLTNTSLAKVTLHIDSDQLGMWIAQVIRANTTLKQLHIRLYNDVIARALQSNQHLTHLRVRSEMDVELLPKELVTSFDQALQIPTVALQSLSVDDGVYRYPMPESLKLQMRLNQCGTRALLQQFHAVKPHQLVDALVNSVTSDQQQEKVDATFALLSQAPELILMALQHDNVDHGEIISKNMDKPTAMYDSKRRSKPLRYPSPSGKEWNKILLTVKSSKKVVQRMFAPSA
jgi:hypothetical protein